MAQYRRSIILIDRPFQLKFSFFVCSWLIAISVIYPLIVYSLFDFFMRYVALDPTGPAVSDVVETRKQVIILLVALQAVFMAVSFLISIFISHRIAGPLFKLKKHMAQLETGNLSEELFFRTKDNFKDVAEAYNRMLSGLRIIFARNASAVNDAASAVEAALRKAPADIKPQLEKALAQLRSVQHGHSGR